jgi:Tol biopolymer transport system component
VWSPDSEHLYFARFIDATGGQTFELDAVNANGTNLRRVANEEIQGVAWSPQGDRVAGTTSDESGPVLWVISADDGSKTRIGRGATPSWSPSGDLLAYRGSDGAYVTRPDGTDVRRLAGPSGPTCPSEVSRAPSGCRSPQWSRDGRNILWASGSAIVVSSADGASGRTVAEGVSAVWSAESDRIAFAALTCGADQGVFVARTDGTDVRRLSRHCTIHGTERRERIVGTPADDAIFARDRKRDRIDCLDGVDRAIVDKVDTVNDCETVHLR